MEKVYPLDTFFTSDLIDIGKFLQENSIAGLLGTEQYDCTADETTVQQEIAELMGSDVESDEISTLSEYCSTTPLVDTVAVPRHLYANPLSQAARNSYEPEKVTAEALKFNTIKKLRERIIIDDKYSYKQFLKYKSDVCPMRITKKIDCPPDLVPGAELLIRIKIYNPFTYTCGKRAQGQPKLNHDLVVFSSQSLVVLRDNIICAKDRNTLKDMSDNPKIDDHVDARDIYKSAFLYIEGTFYNDMRYEDNLDYSDCIRAWAENRPDIGPFNVEAMENTKFTDLKLHLGYPQVYLHQGNCEHLIVFSDIEILQPSDILHSSLYPFFMSMPNSKARYCNMCGLYIVKWKVVESDRVPFDPSYFCELCFQSYNYVDGKKVGNFKACPVFNKGNVI